MNKNISSTTKWLGAIIVISLLSFVKLNAQPTQTVRGVVIDEASDAVLTAANVVLLGDELRMGDATNDAGFFELQNVPVGRYTLKVTMTGYKPAIVRGVVVTSGNEVFLRIDLEERIFELEKLVITPEINKQEPLNEMATVSAQRLSVEEAKRFAGGFNDPARLASAFAGVASSVGTNALVIRGNAPRYLKWRLEAISIPNPNHFAGLSAFGGGSLTALSMNMLADSDFLTGAFPAEYNNALSGVFDLYMRTGNNRSYEHTFQLGFNGIAASSEGPFGKNHSSSYLVNYRYSTLALLAPVLPENASGITYQDLAFNLNFPTKNSGTFTVWGLGLLDGQEEEPEADTTQWEYASDKQKRDLRLYMGAAGLSHKYLFNDNVYIKTILAATASGKDFTTKILSDQNQLRLDSRINNTNYHFVLSSHVTTKFSEKHTNETGISAAYMAYDLLLKNTPKTSNNIQTITSRSGESMLLSAYTSSSVHFTPKLEMNAGLNIQYFTLNNNYTVEPRIGFRWRLGPNQSIGIAYGLHSQLEKIHYYLTEVNGQLINKNLGFTKAHHLVLSYDLDITENLHLTIEPYYQKLFNVPVRSGTSFSFINLHNDWFIPFKLVNEGEGRNIGIDITLQKYFSNHYYFLFTASIFNSTYIDSKGIRRDSRYNKNYVFNFLAGTEWNIGSEGRNTLGLNVRFTYQGGNHYSPINLQASLATQDVIFDESRAFQKQLSPLFLTHLTLSYVMNRENVTHEIALKVLNTTMAEEFIEFRYNFAESTIDKYRETIFIPNVYYKIWF